MAERTKRTKRYKQYGRHFNPFESSAARRAMRRKVKKCGIPTKNDAVPISTENCQECCENDLEASFDGFMMVVMLSSSLPQITPFCF